MEVLDGRNVTFGLNDELLRLSAILPPFKEEIPYGSLALVAYVPSLYSKDSEDKSVGFSFSWVVILGTPNVGTPNVQKSISSKTKKASSSRV